MSRDIDSHSHIDSSFIGQPQDTYDHAKSAFVKGEYIHNIYDSLLLHDTTFTDDEGWELSELFKQFYLFKEMAALYHTGGAHVSSTKRSWKNKRSEDKLNNRMIPEVTKRILEILTPKIVNLD